MLERDVYFRYTHSRVGSHMLNCRGFRKSHKLVRLGDDAPGETEDSAVPSAESFEREIAARKKCLPKEGGLNGSSGFWVVSSAIINEGR